MAALLLAASETNTSWPDVVMLGIVVAGSVLLVASFGRR